MDDYNADYLTKYRVFIEILLKTSDLNYPLPVSVAKYNIAEFELTGEILNWCLTYLNERNCPNSLAAPLCCKVLEEVLQVAKDDPESCGYRTREDDFQPLKLMQKTIKKLVDVCVYYSDNAKLSTLLPPPTATLLDPPVSVCGIKNSRRKMEDRHVAIQDLHALFNIKGCGSASYYAVFDGHNGLDAAVYSSCHVHQYLVESSHYPHNPELALKEAFKKTDDRFVDKSNKENLDSGTTALCALLRPNESMLYVAWLGDSQAVLVSRGKAYQLVKPHRPDQPDERQRINDMGGTVLYMGTWRVNGHLAVSRAIGDRKYKPFVVGEPDVRVIPLTGKEEFLILASDGLWDFVPENEAVNAVYDYLQNHKGDVGGISKHLVQLARNRFSRDNTSVIVVFLSEPEPYKGGRMEASEVEHIWREPYVSKSSNGQFDQHGDEDFGPETDVDGIHDVLTSGFTADTAKAKSLVVQSQAIEEEIGNDVVEAEVEDGSEDDSEDEWNYVSGKNSKRPERKSQVEAFGTPEGRRQDKDEIDDEDDMSRLNPDAAPFVPVFEEDKVLASSPSKGAEISLEDVQVPMVEAFLADISAKPSELESIEYDGCVNEQSINGIDNSDSTNAECGNDIVGQDCKTNDDPAVHSSNPFAVDNIHTQMVSDYFGEHLDLGFKPFDPMQESMIVLESTPSPSAPTGELCDFGQNDKPDLLSPVDNIVDQQTPSSGFESEPADDLDKCDLVAGIFQDRAQHDMVDVENVTIDKSEDTNPFTSTTASDFTSAAAQQENSSELHADEFAHVLDVVQEEKPSEDVDQISPSNLDHVDLIPGITTDSSFEPHAVAPQVNVDLISPDVALHGQAGIVLHEEEANGTKDDVVPCNDVKEMDLLGVDERAKEDAGDSDGFEIISHEEAEIGHQTMNGIHPNDDYPDNYKMNDLVEHSVQIHQAPKTDDDLTPAVRNDDIFGYEYRQELNESECGNVESLKDFQKNHFDDSPAQELNVLDTDQPEVRQEAFENVFSKSSISSTGADDIEPKVEEIISQVEELALEDRIPPVESTDEVLTKSEPEPVQSEPTEGSHDLSPEVPETEVIQTQIITPEPVLTDEVLMVPSELAEKQAVEQANPLDLPTPDNLLVSPVDLSEGISEDMSGDVHVDNEPGKQNGLVADVATPPTTPAPGIEKEDSQDCLIAAAVAAAGAATVTAAAAAVASVAETKVEERPAVTKAAAKPTASKTAAKPATAVSAAKKPTTAKAPVSAAKAVPGKPTAPVKTVAAKPTAPKPASPVSKTATSTTAKPKPALSAAAKPAAPKPAGLTAKPATTAAKPAVAAAKAPIAKPKMPTSTTAPVKKPTTTASTRPPTATTVAKKPEPAKPLAKAPARPTATTTARPTTATKPASATSTARPTSATKPAAKPLPAARTTAVKTTTTAPKPAAPRVPATATKAPAKPTTPVSKTAPAAKAPPKPRPAAPTVLKKAAPAAADKNKPPTKPAPIRKPADKTKPVDKDQTEPPMQEPIVSTTNGHIENGILSNDSPLIASRPIVEALN